MKVIGMFIVAMAIIAFGFIKSNEVIHKKRVLAAFRVFIKDVSCKIEFSANTVIELLQNSSSKELYFLKKITPSLLRENSSLERFIESNCPDKETANIISEFIEGLGTSDRKGQLQHCGLYSGLLEQKSLKINTECDKKCSLYRSLSCLAAAAFLIVMI